MTPCCVLLACLLLLLAFIFCYFTFHKYRFWNKRSVPGPKPLFPFGNLVVKLLKGRPEFGRYLLSEYGKVVGVFVAGKPQLYIMKPDLIRQVTCRDFHHFMNRNKPNCYHDQVNHNLLMSEDEDWKRMRTIVSVAFSSGKLRQMLPLMDKCVEKLIKHLDASLVEGKACIEVKKIVGGFAFDVIASTAFATETNYSQSNPVVEMGYKLLKAPLWKAMAVQLLPKTVLNTLGIYSFLDAKALKFFIDLTTEIIRQRKRTKYIRGDLVQLMMDASAGEDELADEDFEKLIATEEDKRSESNVEIGSKKSLSENEIVSNCIFFLNAGFETTASTLGHCLFELAVNQDVEEKLYEEVRSKFDERNEEDIYEKILSQMSYLEAVIKETLRKYPPASELNRKLKTDNYRLCDFTLPKGSTVIIPVHAIHHCAEYFKHPDRFDPSRFLPDRRQELQPYTYMPFGLGPRNCLGLRFAYNEIKLCLAKLIWKYRFTTTTWTPTRLTFNRISPLLRSDRFELQIIQRTHIQHRAGGD